MLGLWVGERTELRVEVGSPPCRVNPSEAGRGSAGTEERSSSICVFKGQGPGGAGDKNRKRSEETELGWYHMMEVRAGERFNGSDGNSECLSR